MSIFIFLFYQRDIPWEATCALTIEIVMHLARGRRGPAPRGTPRRSYYAALASIPHSHSIQELAYSIRVDFI